MDKKQYFIIFRHDIFPGEKLEDFEFSSRAGLLHTEPIWMQKILVKSAKGQRILKEIKKEFQKNKKCDKGAKRE